MATLLHKTGARVIFWSLGLVLFGAAAYAVYLPNLGTNLVSPSGWRQSNHRVYNYGKLSTWTLSCKPNSSLELVSIRPEKSTDLVFSDFFGDYGYWPQYHDTRYSVQNWSYKGVEIEEIYEKYGQLNPPGLAAIMVKFPNLVWKIEDRFSNESKEAKMKDLKDLVEALIDANPTGDHR